MNRFLDEFLSVIGVILSIPILIGLMFLIMAFCFLCVPDRLFFDSNLAQIEQLRNDVNTFPKNQRFILLQKASETNILIRNRQAQNNSIFTDWAVSDRWNDVQPIIIND